MIPKFRVWNAEIKAMYEVKTLVFTLGSMLCVNRKLVYPERTFYFDDEEICLMQSTGVFDENDLEIFEGDIVTTTRIEKERVYYGYDKTYKGVVKMLKGSWSIDTGDKVLPLYSDKEENVVLGNVYENTELL